MRHFFLSGMQIAFLVIHFSVSLVIKGLLVNICVKLVQAYHLSSTCGPVLSTTESTLEGINTGYQYC